MSREYAIEHGFIRPSADRPELGGWLDVPTLRLDATGRTAARRHAAQGEIRESQFRRTAR